MSIGPIGGVSAAHGSAVPPSAAKPEAAEVKGAVDHDGDADNGAAKAAPGATVGRPRRSSRRSVSRGSGTGRPVV